MANFAEAARLCVSQALVIELAPKSGGMAEFISNQTLALCEGRLALGCPV